MSSRDSRDSREMFGARLRRERERQGITLNAIAKSTKVSRSLYEALERDDVSRWPGGIFRRSFLREYAAAIGLDPEPLLEEFLRLFPEPGTVDAKPRPGPRDLVPLRLTLEPERRIVRLAQAALAAFADAGVVLLAAQAVTRVEGVDGWQAAGMVALAYFTASTIFFGRSGASWCFASLAARRHRPEAPITIAPSVEPAVHEWGSPALVRTPQPEPVVTAVVAAVPEPRLERSA
jgi:transcriptional regulator with XRE-family HTH domain